MSLPLLRRLAASLLLPAAAAFAFVACSGGGGGGGGPPPQLALGVNLSGYWAVTETTTALNGIPTQNGPSHDMHMVLLHDRPINRLTIDPGTSDEIVSTMTGVVVRFLRTVVEGTRESTLDATVTFDVDGTGLSGSVRHTVTENSVTNTEDTRVVGTRSQASHILVDTTTIGTPTVSQYQVVINNGPPQNIGVDDLVDFPVTADTYEVTLLVPAPGVITGGATRVLAVGIAATETVAFTVTFPAPSASFLHLLNAFNTSGSATTIDHPRLNGNPGAFCFATSTWNPPGLSGNSNNNAIGATYVEAIGRWQLYTIDGSPMPVPAGFNVFVPDERDVAFVYTKTSDPSSLSGEIDHPVLNGNRNALVFAMPSGGTANAAPVGVWYNGASSRWEVFNEGFQPMPIGARFLIWVAQGGNAYTLRAPAESNGVALDHPDLNDNPAARCVVTQYWNPPSAGGGVYNTRHIGVWYAANGVGGRWIIFNQDDSLIPLGAGFNVVIDDGL